MRADRRRARKRGRVMEQLLQTALASDISAALSRGGPALWVIAALSVVTLALIMWKIWHFWRIGAWGGARTTAALAAWMAGDAQGATALLRGRHSLRAAIVEAAINARIDPALGGDLAREETTRIARAALAEARTGLRPLDLIATIAPLIGLLGTVLGMIEAFQVLQSAGSRADPSALAGGIWEALLTTAAGMGVAIPAAMALAWADGVVERLEAEMEDIATQVFTRGPAHLRRSA